jgi:hypothetical protein
MVEGFSKTVKFTKLVYDQKYYSYHFLVFTTTSRNIISIHQHLLLNGKMMIVKLSLLTLHMNSGLAWVEITHSIERYKMLFITQHGTHSTGKGSSL